MELHTLTCLHAESTTPTPASTVPSLSIFLALYDILWLQTMGVSQDLALNLFLSHFMFFSPLSHVTSLLLFFKSCFCLSILEK